MSITTNIDGLNAELVTIGIATEIDGLNLNLVTADVNRFTDVVASLNGSGELVITFTDTADPLPEGYAVRLYDNSELTNQIIRKVTENQSVNFGTRSAGTYWITITAGVSATVDPAPQPTVYPDSEQDDRDALLAMNSSLTGLGWDNTVIDSGDLNTLTGVTAETQDGEQRVVEVDFNSMGLTGELTEEIGNFNRIRFFNIKKNALYSSVPHSIENWVNIEYLMFSGNDDGIPGKNPHPGKTMDYTNMRFHGTIPDVFDKMPNLKVFELYWSKDLDEQPYPSTLYRHPSLTHILVSGNNFTGQLVDDFNLPELEVFHIGSNQLSGNLPSTLGNSTKILKLFVGHSDNFIDGVNFDGSPMGSKAENFFTGTIPSSYSNLINLERFSVGNQNLEGEIPSFIIENWSGLREILIGNNNFMGEVPAEFGDADLIIFDISNNNFTDTLPERIASGMQNVILFNVRNNNLSGDFPNGEMINGEWKGWRTKTQLRNIYAGSNNFTGSLPDMPEYVGDVSQMIFDRNNFTGGIPDTWEELFTPALRNVNPNRELSLLRLGNNDLQGILPAWFTSANGITSQTGGNRWSHRDILENGADISDGEGLGIKPFGFHEEFSVASGDAFTFDYSHKVFSTDSAQWTKDGNPISGQTTHTLTLTNVTENGTYRLELTNANSGLPPTIVSEPIILTVT